MMDYKLKLLQELGGEAGNALAHELRGRYRADDVSTDKSAAGPGGAAEPEAAPDLLMKDLQDPAIQELLGGLMADTGDNNSDKTPKETVIDLTVEGDEPTQLPPVNLRPDDESLPEQEDEPEPQEAPMPPTPSDEEEDESAEVNRASLDRAGKEKVKSRRLWAD